MKKKGRDMSMPYPSSNYPQYQYTPNPNPGYAVPGAPRNDIPKNQNPYGQNFVPNYGTVVPPTGFSQPQPPAQPGFICSPVTSKEEAVATRVEAFGPGVIMPDFGDDMIYFKRFNSNTALADFAQFRRVPDDEETNTEDQKPPVPQIDVGAIIGAFQNRFDSIENKMDEISEKLSAKQPPRPVSTKGATKR